MKNLLNLFSGESWINEFMVTEIFIVNGYLHVTSGFDLHPSKYQGIADQLCAYGYDCVA